MKFKEFVAWCNKRASDGCWGLQEAMICISIMEEVREKPFWRREKFWRETCMKWVCDKIVYPINQKIEEMRKE